MDEFQQSANCTVSFTVHDKENPRILYCPSDIKSITFRKDKRGYVTWPEPEFDDNVGLASIISGRYLRTHRPDHGFPILLGL